MYISPEEDPIQNRQAQLSEIKDNLEGMINMVESLIYEQGFLDQGNKGGLLTQVRYSTECDYSGQPLSTPPVLRSDNSLRQKQLSDIVENLEEMVVKVESLLDGQETRVQDNRDGRFIQVWYSTKYSYSGQASSTPPVLRSDNSLQRRYDPFWDWEVSDIERDMPGLLEPGW